MEATQIKGAVEALIFAAEEPIGVVTMLGVLEADGVTREQIQTALEQLTRDYNDGEGRGLLLREVGGGFQFVTQPGVAVFIQRLNQAKPKTLSQAALETLAIIAYRQPVVRAEVEQIRGVDTGGVLKTLLEKGFIKIVGRREEAGQPLIYGTTKAFLELFHLKSLEELPSMREIEELVETQLKKDPTAVGDEATSEAMPESSVVEELSAGDWAQDQELLEELEGKVKGLRRLEQEIFPKPPEVEGQPAEGTVPENSIVPESVPEKS